MRKNLNPNYWGPCAWQFLHDAATGIDDESMQYFVQLVALLPHILPCKTCREHTAEYLKTTPVNVHNPRLWLSDLRTCVRERKRRVPLAEGVLALLLICVLVSWCWNY